MKLRFAFLLLIVNLFATTVGLWSFRIDSRKGNELPAANLKEGIAAYLASAPTPTELETRSAEIAELLIQGDAFAEGWRARTYRALRYPVILGGINVILIIIAMGWKICPSRLNSLNSHSNEARK